MKYDEIKEKVGKTIFDLKEKVTKEYNDLKKAINEEKVVCEYCDRINTIKRGSTNAKCAGCGANLK
jgi:LSD1 subclass zinc finger protein